MRYTGVVDYDKVVQAARAEGNIQCMLIEYIETLVLAGPSLALISRTFLDHKLVDVPLVPRLVTTFGRCAPNTNRMDVTLGFTTLSLIHI